MGPLKNKFQDKKLLRLKTHDYHILLQQVLPVCLWNIGKSNVIGAIVQVSRLFYKKISKVIDSEQKLQMLKDVAKIICSLEKELPPFIFVVMKHLPIHLVEEPL